VATAMKTAADQRIDQLVNHVVPAKSGTAGPPTPMGT
jgi:hypothetical protein